MFEKQQAKEGVINWQCGGNGQVLWSFNCDILGHDIDEVRVGLPLCGLACLDRVDCSTFAWTTKDEGTCYLKNGGHEFIKGDVSCGKVVKRNTVAVTL